MRADLRVAGDQIPRPGEQIGEVERARRALQLLVARRRAGELLLQAGGEIGVGVLAELLQIVEQRVARGEDLGAGDVAAELVAAALARPREAAIARQIDEPRLPAVEVDLTERFLEAETKRRAQLGRLESGSLAP